MPWKNRCCICSHSLIEKSANSRLSLRERGVRCRKLKNAPTRKATNSADRHQRCRKFLVTRNHTNAARGSKIFASRPFKVCSRFTISVDTNGFYRTEGRIDGVIQERSILTCRIHVQESKNPTVLSLSRWPTSFACLATTFGRYSWTMVQRFE